MRSAWLLLPLSLASTGCIDTDAAVFVEARIDQPTAAVEQSALATGLSGGFQMHFHLGPRASGDGEVGLSGFFVTDAGGATLVESLAVATAQSFPVIVPIDGDVSVGATFSADENLLEVTAIDTLCAAGGLRVVGVFQDSLRGGSIDASSPVFVPAGCP